MSVSWFDRLTMILCKDGTNETNRSAGAAGLKPCAMIARPYRAERVVGVPESELVLGQCYFLLFFTMAARSASRLLWTLSTMRPISLVPSKRMMVGTK